MTRKWYCKHGLRIGAQNGNCVTCVIPVNAPLPDRVCAGLVHGAVIGVVATAAAVGKLQEAVSIAGAAVVVAGDLRFVQVGRAHAARRLQAAASKNR